MITLERWSVAGPPSPILDYHHLTPERVTRIIWRPFLIKTRGSCESREHWEAEGPREPSIEFGVSSEVVRLLGLSSQKVNYQVWAAY